ncbi:MFS transporter [Vineibacter terrae]|uniref:MFS transporter n=1 Tax=Vineibacter terrae TaxID=2586908 RepID=A0A5C8PAI9_9HYPH|nr:MFS transporter [Vineibacter terrae]TXL70778.1 MFS transporter [Vineibacter terrae]
MADAPRSYAQVLRLPDVSNLLIAACLSRLAGRTFTLAIVLYVLGAFRSPELAGWVSFASMVPGMLASPLAGALLDRVGTARAIVIDMVAGTALLAALLALHVVQAVSPPLLLVLVALYSLTSPLSAAGIRTLIARLVPAPARDCANALDTGSYALVDVLGPVLAGLLFGFAGPGATFLVIAALYGAAALSLVALVRRPAAGPATGRIGSLSGEALAGLVYVVRHRTLRGLAVSYSLYQVSFGILLVAVPVFVMRALGDQAMADSVVGVLWALSGVAGSLGALYAGHVQAAGRERLFIAAGALATAVAIYPVCAHFGLAGMAVGLIVVGLLTGPVDVGVLTLRQSRTDPAWLGRALAISMSLNTCGLPIGAALGGMLAGHSLGLTFAVAGAASIIAAVAAFGLVPKHEPPPSHQCG